MTNPHLVEKHPLLDLTIAPAIPIGDKTERALLAHPSIVVPDKIPLKNHLSSDPLAFTHFDPNEEILRLDNKGQLQTGKVGEILNMSFAWWHLMRNKLTDIFSGEGTISRNWENQDLDRVGMSKLIATVMFEEFIDRTGINRYAFHTRDLVPFPESKDMNEFERDVMTVVEHINQLRSTRPGVEPLWGTAALFSDREYAAGAAVAKNDEIFAYALREVEISMKATYEQDGKGYTLWGGREGWDDLVNSLSELDRDKYAKFLEYVANMNQDMATHYGKPPLRLYIEPKSQEPTTKQIDADTQACLNFLRQYDLLDAYTLNIEVNHATLAGHSVESEMDLAIGSKALGSIDLNTGKDDGTFVGWDVDQFLRDRLTAMRIGRQILRNDTLGVGGCNLDAKQSRLEIDPLDGLIGAILSANAMAVGIKAAALEQVEGIMMQAKLNLRDSGAVDKAIREGKDYKAILEIANGLGPLTDKLRSSRASAFRAMENNYVDRVIVHGDFNKALKAGLIA